MITKQTQPLAKAIRTLEGVLVVLLDVAVGATAAIDPSTLSPKWAAIIVGGQHVALLLQRGFIKVAALKSVAGAVTSPDPLGAILKEVEALTGAAPKDPTPAPVALAPVGAVPPAAVVSGSAVTPDAPVQVVPAA